MGKSSIEWTDRTLNPIRARNLATKRVGWHCEHVNDDCINCYAEGINLRLGTGLPFKPGHRKDVEIFLDRAMLVTALAEIAGKPQRIFITSMTDAALAHGDWLAMLDAIFGFAAIARHCQVQILTKRPRDLRRYVLSEGREAFVQVAAHPFYRDAWKAGQNTFGSIRYEPKDSLWFVDWPLPNVWLGFSAGTQSHFDAMWAEMKPLAEAGWHIFASLEPLHEPIVLPADFLALRERAWVIVGGESKGLPSSKPRPTHPAWVRALQRQCAIAGVWFFFKQWGHWLPGYDRERDDPDWRRCDAVARETPKGRWMNDTGGHGFHGQHVVRMNPVGKKAAGAELDGQLYQQLPPFYQEAA
jgi:protein gp37